MWEARTNPRMANPTRIRYVRGFHIITRVSFPGAVPSQQLGRSRAHSNSRANCIPVQASLRFGVDPRPPVRPAQELIRLLVTDDLLLGRIPGQCSAEAQRQVRQDAAGRRDKALLN